MKYNATLYGSDIDIVDSQSQPKNEVSLTELVQSDLAYETFNNIGLFNRPSLTSETVTYLNGFQSVNNEWRYKYTLKVYPKSLPDSPQEDDVFYFTNVLTKKKHWLYIPLDYYLLPTGHVTYPIGQDPARDALKAISVLITGYKDVTDNDPKYIEIELSTRYKI